MQIYVINMTKAKDRLSRIQLQLQAQRLSWKRIEAIDGKALNIKDSCINPYRFRLTQRRDCLPGEIGCMESHRLAWETALKQNCAHTLILEDDAILPDDLKVTLESIESKTELDIINLSFCGTYPLSNEKLKRLKSACMSLRPYFRGKKDWKEIEAKRWKIFSLLPVNKLTLCECSMMPPFMTAYVVTPRACKALLDASKNASFCNDYTYRFTAGSIRQAFSFPAYVHQDPELKSITGIRPSEITLSLWNRMLRFILKRRPIRRQLAVVRMYGIKGIL
jgi:GR25 family glycosyltransferase involved in LPS biosynthesis|tara:strand:+ start:345 stop:1178 length:834 start_codon:yes stop_codon:yes gene_type:complete